MSLRRTVQSALLSGLAFASADARAQAYVVSEIPLDIAYGINDAGVVTGGGPGFFAYVWDSPLLLPLGTLGGASAYSDKINEWGEVVGAAETASGDRHAYLHTGGSMIDLGTLGGSSSDARGLNTWGQVVGASWTAGDLEWRAWTDTGAGMVMLPSFGGTYSGAEAINEAGTIVGWSDYSTTSTRRAFRYDNGVLTDLGTLAGPSGATDVNDDGLIVGWAENANGRSQPVYWENNTLHRMPLPAGATSATVNAVSESGRMVGTASEMAAVYHAWGTVLLQDLVGGTTLDLMRAEDVNGSGQIVGYAYDTADQTLKAYVATPTPLVLAPPTPGIAGVMNSFMVTGANPGSTVRLVYGTRAGTSDLSRWCRGEQLEMRNPAVGATAAANVSGIAMPSAVTPAGGSGVTVRYQALELDSCRVSNLVTYTYP